MAGEKTRRRGGRALVPQRRKLGFERLEVRRLLTGDLDLEFGAGGILRPSLNDTRVNTHETQVATVGDQVVVATRSGQDFVLARFNASGDKDASFGDDGVASAFDQGISDAVSLATMIVNGEVRYVVGAQTAGGFKIARFTASGRLDATFGAIVPNGGGVRSGIAMFSPEDSGVGIVFRDLTVDSQNRIIAVGERVYTTGAPPAVGIYANVVVARFTADGQLDASFAGLGYAYYDIPVGLHLTIPFAVTTDSSDRIIATGMWGQISGSSNPFVVRLTASGAMDQSFGTNGYQIDFPFSGFGIEMGRDVAVDAAGRIVMVVDSSSGFRLARLTDAGEFDPGFGNAAVDFLNGHGEAGDGRDGITSYLREYPQYDPPAANAHSQPARALRIDGQGRILVAGYVMPDWWDLGVLDARFAVARFRSDGSIDPSFNSGVLKETDVSFGAFDAAYSMALDSAGRIVVAGGYNVATDIQEDGHDGPFLAVVRYRADAPPPNTPPVAGDDAYFVDEDGDLVVPNNGVLANDEDADGHRLTVQSVVAGPANGVLQLSATGGFTYRPRAHFHGVDTFTYRARDDFNAQSNVATVTITVRPVNDAPNAADDFYTTSYETPLVIAANGVLANDVDVDVDGDTPTAVLATPPPPEEGTLALNADGSFTFTPASGFRGPARFTYRASDGSLSSPPATVTIHVGSPPVATLASQYKIAAGGSWYLPPLFLLAQDPEGDTIERLEWDLHRDGTVDFSSSAADFNRPNFGIPWNVLGLEATGAPYEISVAMTPVARRWDGAEEVGAAATTTLLVAPPPDIVYVDSQRFTYFQGGDPYNVPFDPDGAGPAELLGYDAFPDIQMAIDAVAAGGRVTVAPGFYFQGSGGVIGFVAADAGNPGFTPHLTNHGKPLTLEIAGEGLHWPEVRIIGDVLFDEHVTLSMDIVSPTEYERLNVVGRLALDGPTLVLGGGYVPGEAIDAPIVPVTAQGLRAQPGEQSLIGAFANLADGAAIAFNGGRLRATYAYVEPGAFGPDEIRLLPVVEDPRLVAHPDEYAMNEDGSLDVPAETGVLANDENVGGFPLTVTLGTPPQNGTLALREDGSFTYQPDANFFGVVEFTYHVSNGGLADLGVVTITVAPVNDPPVAEHDGYAVDEDGLLAVPAAGGVLANDNDEEGDALTAVLVATTQHGLLTLNPDGSFSYQPAEDFFGFDSFTYRAFDGTDHGNVATVNLAIVADNDPPTLASDGAVVSVVEGDVATHTGSWHDVDDPTAVTLSASVGAVVKHDDGTWSWSGVLYASTRVTISALDGEGGAASVSFDVDVEDIPMTVAINGLPTEIVGEGESVELQAVVSGVDPAADLNYYWYVDGEFAHYAENDPTFDFVPPEHGQYEITVQAWEGDVFAQAVSPPIHAADVAPQVTLRGPKLVNTGATVRYEFETTHPPTVDTFSLLVTSGGAAGTVSNVQIDPATGAGGFDVTFGEAIVPTKVRVQVQDSDGLSSNLSTIEVQVAGRPGTLDTTFGQNGIALGVDASNFDNSFHSHSTNVAVQPNGKIIVARSIPVSGSTLDFELLRFNLDGSPDLTFGQGGRVTTNVGPFDQLSKLLLQPDGKIVVVGYDFPRVVLVRYNSNGSLDSSFGVAGRVLFSGGIDVTDAALQDDGKIVVVGVFTTFESEPNQPHLTPLSFTAVLRFLPDGRLDPTINPNGTIYTPVPESVPGIFSYSPVVAVQSDGRILIGTGMRDGPNSPTLSSTFLLIRLLPNGFFDASFGDGGWVVWDNVHPNKRFANFLFDLVVQPDGKITLSSRGDGGSALTRFRDDGQLDSSFGDSGISVLEQEPTDFVIQKNGRFVIWSRGSNTLFRLNPNGQIDDTFPPVRVNNLNFDNRRFIPEVGRSSPLALQADGKIIFAHRSRVNFNAPSRSGAVRFWGDVVEGHAVIVEGDAQPAADDDTLAVDLVAGTYSINGGAPQSLVGVSEIDFDGGEGTNILSLFAARNDVVYVPDPEVHGKGYITTAGGLRINFVNLTPVDFDDVGTLTLYLPGGDDLVEVSEDFNTAPTAAGEPAGTVPALRLSGSSGGVGFEQAHVFRTRRIVIDTTDLDGHDAVTILGAENAHGNGRLEVRTGAGADLVTLAGKARFAEGVTIASPAARLDADLEAATVIVASDVITLGAGPRAIRIDGDFTATGALAVDVHGTVAGLQHDQLVVTGVADLSGVTLAAAFGGGYVPAAGHLVELIRGEEHIVPAGSLADGAAVGALHARYTTTQLALVGRAANQPNLTSVRLSSTAWSQAFKDYVDVARGAGPGVGYAAAIGSSQFVPLPWGNLNQIALTFDRDVHRAGGGAWLSQDVAVYGVDGEYPVAAVGLSGTRTVLITLRDALPADKLLVVIPRTVLIDDQQNMPAEDVTFRFNVLPGDANRDGKVLGSDVGRVRLAQFSALEAGVPSAGYSMYADLDGSSAILGSDVGQTRLRQFGELPDGEPAAIGAAEITVLATAAIEAAVLDPRVGWLGAAVSSDVQASRPARPAYRPAAVALGRFEPSHRSSPASLLAAALDAPDDWAGSTALEGEADSFADSIDAAIDQLCGDKAGRAFSRGITR